MNTAKQQPIYSYYQLGLSLCLFFSSLTILEAGLNPLTWFGKEPDTDIIDLGDKSEEKAARWVQQAEQRAAAGSIDASQRIYKKILNQYPRISAAGPIAYQRGLYLFEKGKWIEAFEAFKIIKLFHPDLPQLDAVIDLHYKSAENAMNQHRRKTLGIFAPDPLNQAAAPLFIEYAQLYPFDAKAPEALLNAALIFRSSENLELAISTLKKLINNYPNSSVTAQAYFDIAHIYSEFIKGPAYDLESTREAIRYCEDFIALFPDHDQIGEVEALYAGLLNTLATNRVLLADYYYFNRRDTIAALIFYNEAITLAPKSQAANEAQVRLDAIEQGLRPTTGSNFIKKLFFIR